MFANKKVFLGHALNCLHIMGASVCMRITYFSLMDNFDIIHICHSMMVFYATKLQIILKKKHRRTK